MRRAPIAAALCALLAAPAAALPDAAAPGVVQRALRAAGVARGLEPDAPAVERPGAAVPHLIPAGLPYRDALALLVPALARAKVLRDDALAAVSDDELAFARRVAERATLAPGEGSAIERARAAAIVARIDTAALLHGTALIADAVERALPLLTGPGPDAVTCTPSAVLCIGTSGDDVYDADVQILIDPGGDDVYRNNAGGVLYQPGFESTGGCVFGGGSTGRARPDLSCTSAPSTVCTYDTANRAAGRDDLPETGLPGHDHPADESTTHGSCGSDARRDAAIDAILGTGDDGDARGIALLLDATGSDTYTVPWSHDDPLFDLIDFCFPGETDRVNTNRDLFQGSALGGIGILWDAGDGDDRYRGRLNAQGTGHVGGVGLLVTTGRGDATFWADRLAQGNGIGGGIGALVNTKDGTHTYLLDPPVVYRNEFGPNGRACTQEGRAGQGQGGFGGAGVLWNENAGDAVYRAVVHVTAEAHPFLPVIEDGRPVLVGGNDAQGSGESFPIVDTPGGIVAGAGLLIDATDGDASVCPEREPGAPGAGMLAGSSEGAGTDLSSMGIVDRSCGTFNLPTELDPAGDLGIALQRLAAGAVGVRVVR